MGNGASRNRRALVVDGQKIEVSRLKMLYPELKRELTEKNDLLAVQSKHLEEKEKEIMELRKEIHQLRCVIDEKTVKTANNSNGALGSIEESMFGPQASLKDLTSNFHRMDSKSKFVAAAITAVRYKRLGVSAESGRKSGFELQELQRHPKNSDNKRQIKKAIAENNFLKHLEKSQVQEIVNCMYLKSFTAAEYVIKEGESASTMYVCSAGKLEVSKSGETLGKPLGPGTLFGELAILYNCTRTASVRALEDVKVWTLERQTFQIVMKRTGMIRREEDFRFLRSIPLIKELKDEDIYKIVDVADEDFYHADEYIVREGEAGDTFFIIKEGTVKVFQHVTGQADPQEVRALGKGDYFGEKALLSEDVRTATIIAQSPGVVCLVIEREIFLSVLGPLSELKDKDYGDEERGAMRISPKISCILSGSRLGENKKSISPELAACTIDDFKYLATLGIGGFGRVELVQDKRNPGKSYALKCLIKAHVIETRQQEHVFNEKKILLELSCDFIIRLHRTFKDKKYVYLLMEVCLGGELWTVLRDKNYFDEPTTRFYIACVVEAFDYLHRRGIVYRDLKPENLLMDGTGYIKLVDFGFAKQIGTGRKTWTFCGTPEYVAPEIILNKGHDLSADYWSLGILIFELMTGNPPFSSSDPMNTYNVILRGIDALEFPSLVTKTAQHLVKKLCRDNPSERLGNQKGRLNDIRKHKWFQGFYWQGLMSHTLKAPILPKVKGPLDHSNFDHFPSSRDTPPDEISGWDKDF